MHHLADVAACLETLLDQQTIRSRLATSADWTDIDTTTAARLCVLAGLHDIGKVNIGFQTQIWRDEDNPPRLASFRGTGHTVDLTPVLVGEDKETSQWFFNALGWWSEATATWDDTDGETVCALLIAALSHHGRPLPLYASRHANPAIWRPYKDLYPQREVEQIGAMIRSWYPNAFVTGAQPLPRAPAFQHMFLGLCNLADWLGSNTVWFPYEDRHIYDYMVRARRQARQAVEAVGIDIAEQRLSLEGRQPAFEGLFPPLVINAVQRAAVEKTPLDAPLAVVESETGSGKTEAALWRFAKMYEAELVDGMYFALPTRAAATQLHRRVAGFAERLFPKSDRPEPVLAVPGYLQAGEATGKQLPHYAVEWGDNPHDDVKHRRWAAESAKRFLAAQIAVGTIDQAMMGALQVKNAHMRATCLSRSLLVVDEVHASDVYMRRILRALLAAHLGAGGYALLMSATLGAVARWELLSVGRRQPAVPPTLADAVSVAYPAVSISAADTPRIVGIDRTGGDKDVQVETVAWMHEFDQVAETALAAARAGGKVLVVRNTVAHAVRTQQALEATAPAGSDLLFACRGVTTLHHGRFTAADRRLLDGAVEERLGRDRPSGGMVVVGTQTLEQSLDIDADLLITDLCPTDVLLQRIGRLHRHERSDRTASHAEPRCIVLTPAGDDLSPLLQRGEAANGLGPHGGVYVDLRALEATRWLIMGRANWRIPEMNRELVEHATHPKALEKIAQNKDETWVEHGRWVEGGHLAEGLTAANAVIRRDKSFYTENSEALFHSDEERIRTRLGDEGFDVELVPPQPSPFASGEAIDRIVVPARWLRGVDVEEPAGTMPAREGGFVFTVSDRSFRYDRWGLRREGEITPPSQPPPLSPLVRGNLDTGCH